MQRTFLLGLLVLIATPAQSADTPALVSGLQVGERPSGFTVLNVTGPKQGTTLCYRCRYGIFPTVCIFARDTSKPLTELIARIDARIDVAPELKCFVVFLTNDDIEDRLKALEREKNLKHISLTTLKSSDSPLNYRISAGAGVTVMMWKDLVVRSNHAFARMADTNIEAVLADLPKVLGK
jgi:hypothetical protein